MAISLFKGTIVRVYDMGDTVNAVCLWQFTSTLAPTAEFNHTGIPKTDLLAIAAAAGRSYFTWADIASYITTADLSPATVVTS